MQFISFWCITTFIVFLVKYFPPPTVIDLEFVLKAVGWGLFWAVIVNLVLIVVMFIIGYKAIK